MTRRTTLLLLMLSAMTRAAEPLPYDALQSAVGKYLNPNDALAWPAKVDAIAKDEFHFWRGTRDLFYAWAGHRCRDWLADPNAYAVSHGDLHLGNTGSFAAGPKLGRIAYGLVDFDDSARLPIQLELLQGIVTFELIARTNKLNLTEAQRQTLRETLLNTYAKALARPPADVGMAKLIKDRSARKYSVDLERFTHNHAFRTTVVKDGDVTDRLKRLPESEWPAVARGLAEAVQHDARLAKLLRPYDAADFQSAILDVAERTRVESSGSQGLVKLLVLLRQPFRDETFDGLLYLKRQIPAAAERAGIVPKIEGSPGRRYVRDLDVLQHGQALAASWCEIDGRAFWVSVKEPWSDEPESGKLQSFESLLQAATVWANVAADSHRAVADRLTPLMTKACFADVSKKADDCLAWNHRTFEAFVADERTSADRAVWKATGGEN